MGKFNNSRPTYIQRQIQRSGPEWHKRMNSLELQRGAIQIFRDLSRGNIDLATESQYFLDHQFITSCIQAAIAKLSLHSTNYRGVALLMTTDPSEGMQNILNFDQKCTEAYTIIYTNLQKICDTNDVTYLSQLIAQLCPRGAEFASYRNNI